MRDHANALLSSIPVRAYAHLEHDLERVALVKNAVLQDQDWPVTYSYFPQAGMISTLMSTTGGQSVDVGMVGSEGMIGLPFPGNHVSPYRCVVTLPGTALRIGAEDLLDHARRSPEIIAVLWDFTGRLQEQSARMVHCIRFHSVRERCALTLLLLQDRWTSDDLPLTHDFLADMLGVHRPGATSALSGLEAAGAVTNSGRGHLRVDRRRLRDESCECYEALRPSRAMPV